MLDVSLVQQGAWDMPLDSMPLAAGYLKAAVDADPELCAGATVSIHNFRGGRTLHEMARELFHPNVPDVLAFSVLGWNYRTFGQLADTFKQIRPDGVVVFGGNHVAYQAARVFREYPWIDVVVNGEGERTFRELVSVLLSGPKGLAETQVPGLSVLLPDGSVRTTAERDRIEDLNTVPSPFLTGAIPMVDSAGRFPYDVALMETNRGCPYKCAFCYWGGAVGQRMRTFSTDRLAAELDMFGYHQVPAVVLCDSNFGLLESDEEFVELLIKTRERHGYPRALETSWAKNKSERFYRIVRDLTRHGFKSSFTLALQTLSDEALIAMSRRNMKVNKWEGLVNWLLDEGLDCYAELIWGAPGETPASFLEGYDRLAVKVPRIAIYPMLLLPNTSYTENRALHGFVTVRGETDDFEYVLSNRTSTIAENLEMQRFIYWARILGENQYLRTVWRPVRDLTGLTQSGVVRSLDTWFAQSDVDAAREMVEAIPLFAESPAIAGALRALYSRPELADLVARWWQERMIPMFPAEWRCFAGELYRYETWCRPRYVESGCPVPEGWRLEVVDREPCYVSEPVSFSIDVAATLADWEVRRATGPTVRDVEYVFTGRAGFFDHLDNHETAAHYIAEPRPASPVPSG